MAVYGLSKRSRGIRPMVVVNQPAQRARRPVRPKQVVVVRSQRSRRGRRGRGKRNGNNPRAIGGSGGATVRVNYEFSKDDIAGNSNGRITFGKDLSDHPAFSSGIIKAFHEYKITKLQVVFKSEAPSTAGGSIAYELDPHCELDSLQSKLYKFGFTRDGTKTWTAKAINGLDWHSTNENQFTFLYKGNSKTSDIVGSFRMSYTVQCQNPK
nr:coat protein [Carrot polerovirus 1]